jgi:hypothetical protein
MRIVILRFSAVFMLLLGLVSLFLSVSYIFNLFQLRNPQEHYPFFILFVGFICSIIYLFAAYGFLKEDKRTTLALFIGASILILSFMGLLVHIMVGGLYEVVTIRSLVVRTFITLVFTAISWNYLIKQEMVIS